MPMSTSGRRRRHATVLVALLSSLLLASGLALTANARSSQTSTKPYTALWVDGSTTAADLGLSSGNVSVTLRLSNLSNQQSFGSANITAPSGYTLHSGSAGAVTGTVVGNTLQLRMLNVAPMDFVDVSISVTTPCLAPWQVWTTRVKQANDFSGSPGNDFTLQLPAPRTSVTGQCLLAFVNQPKDTLISDATNTHLIKSGIGSTGNQIQVKVVTPAGALVNTTAAICLTLVTPAGAQSTTVLETTSSSASSCEAGKGVSLAAVGGVATFPIFAQTLGFYRLRASSAAASNTPTSDGFSIAETIEACTNSDCTLSQLTGGTLFEVTPKRVTSGAMFVASRNPFTITCDFAPFNYPDSRQPDGGVWFSYNGNGTKTLQIFIPKEIVQLTPENGTSKYRFCFSSPAPFKTNMVTGWDLIGGVVTQTGDGSGVYAPPDAAGGTVFFGVTWYTGLLPDCGSSKNPPAPCQVGWTGTTAGDRVGTAIAPEGDPFLR